MMVKVKKIRWEKNGHDKCGWWEGFIDKVQVAHINWYGYNNYSVILKPCLGSRVLFTKYKSLSSAKNAVQNEVKKLIKLFTVV